MTQISPYMQAFDERSPLERQTLAENRRDNWLRQMELALLSEMNQANEPRKHTDGNEDSQQEPSRKRTAGETSQARLVPATTPANSTATTVPPAAKGDADRSTLQSKGDATSLAHSMANEGAMIHAISRKRISPPYNVASPCAGETAAQSLDLQTASTVDSQSPAIQPSAPRSTIPTGVLRTTPEHAMEDFPSSIDEALPPEPSTDAPELDEMPVWQKRLMHVTRDGENVNVWIRDSELSPAQEQNVIARLTNEFAETGMRLGSATINGKLRYRAKDEPSFGADIDARSNGNDAETRPSTITNTGKNHAA